MFADNKRYRFRTGSRLCTFTVPKRRLLKRSSFILAAIVCCSMLLMFSNHLISLVSPYGFYNNFVDFQTNYSFETILKPIDACSKPRFAIFLIASRAESRELRETIRRTWMSKLNAFESRGVFVLGTSVDKRVQASIDEEFQQYGDLIQENFVDVYFNLSLKSVVALKWAVNTCHNRTKYVLKIDDDTYVNVPRLMRLLTQNRNPDMLLGSVGVAVRPIRMPFEKAYCPRSLYAPDTYPAFLGGFGYAMTFRIAVLLYEHVIRLPFFHLEDVLLTGLAAQKANINLLHNDQFLGDETSLDILLKNIFVLVHRSDPHQMWSLFNNNI